MASEQATEQAVMVFVMAHRRLSAKPRLQCRLAGILLAVVHLLQELLRLLLVDEGQARQTLLQFEGMEEDAILVVVPVLKDLLIPDNTAVSRLGVCQQDALNMRLPGGAGNLPRCPPF